VLALDLSRGTLLWLIVLWHSLTLVLSRLLLVVLVIVWLVGSLSRLTIHALLLLMVSIGVGHISPIVSDYFLHQKLYLQMKLTKEALWCKSS
jgi:hypothetical protein